MSHMLNAGIEISPDNGSTWYKLTDDNRQPINIQYEVIEKTNRMADGQLRRYVVARKHKISTSWQNIPSASSHLVNKGFDGQGAPITQKVYNVSDASATDIKIGKAGAWMKSFYEANVFLPIKVRLTMASETTQNIQTNIGFVPDENTYVSSLNAESTGNNTYDVFITGFTYEVVKRNRFFDLVNINMDFTEV